MKTKNTTLKLITMALALFMIASTTAHAQTSPPARRTVVINKYVVKNVYRSGGASNQPSFPGQGYYGYHHTRSFGGEHTTNSYSPYHRSSYYGSDQNPRYPQEQARTPGGYQPSSNYESNMPPQSQQQSYPMYQRQSSPSPYMGQSQGGYDSNSGDQVQAQGTSNGGYEDNGGYAPQEQVQGTGDNDSQETAPAAPVASSSHHKKKHQSLFKRLEHGVEREIHPVLRDARHDAERQIHPVLRQARTDAEAWAASQLGL